MYKFLTKNGPMFAFLGAAVFILISVIPVFSGLSAFSAIETKQQAFAPEGDIFYPGLYITAILLGLAVVLAVLLGLFNVFSNPKAAIKGLISFGAIAVLFFIFYSMADSGGSASLMNTIQTFAVSEPIVKIIDGGIFLTLIMTVGSAVLIAVMEVLNFFKNQ